MAPISSVSIGLVVFASVFVTQSSVNAKPTPTPGQHTTYGSENVYDVNCNITDNQTLHVRLDERPVIVCFVNNSVVDLVHGGHMHWNRTLTGDGMRRVKVFVDPSKPGPHTIHVLMRSPPTFELVHHPVHYRIKLIPLERERCTPLIEENQPGPGLRVNSSAGDENSVVHFSCANNYTLVGSAERRCQSNGTWSGTQATCIPNPGNVYVSINGIHFLPSRRKHEVRLLADAPHPYFHCVDGNSHKAYALKWNVKGGNQDWTPAIWPCNASSRYPCSIRANQNMRTSSVVVCKAKKVNAVTGSKKLLGRVKIGVKIVGRADQVDDEVLYTAGDRVQYTCKKPMLMDEEISTVWRRGDQSIISSSQNVDAEDSAPGVLSILNVTPEHADQYECFSPELNRVLQTIRLIVSSPDHSQW